MTKKVFASALCAIIIGGALSSCEDGNIKKLKTEVAVAQAQTPLPAGVMGNIASVDYIADSNAVMFSLAATPQSIDSAFVAANPQLCLPIIKLALNRDVQAEVLRQMGAAGASAQVGYSGVAMLDIPADSIKAMLASPLTGRDAAYAELEGYAALFSSRCPQTVAGLNIVNVEMTDTAMVYNATPATGSLAALKADVANYRHNLWNAMKEQATTTEGRDCIKQLFDNNLSIVYSVSDANASAPVDMTFPYKEVYFLIK